MSSKLFTPIRVGNITLENRIAMAPLTRFRANDDDHVPLPFVKDYYSQRSIVPGTLLVTEGVFIAAKAGGYNNAPGIWSEAQIDAWKVITDAVHKNKSFIFLQLWALGRAGNPGMLKKELGESTEIVSASDISFKGGATPRPLRVDEIYEYISLYAQAAKNAVAAGFDGVEIHGANGYLIDQFTQDVSNQRTDEWGGSIPKRARFGIEVAKAVSAAIGADKVGFRISPYNVWQGMKMKDPKPQFTYLVGELRHLHLAYLHIVESWIAGIDDVESTDRIDYLVDVWDNVSPVFVAGGFLRDTAIKAVDEDYKNNDVVIVFGRYFISNPDLVYRLRESLELTPWDATKFYTPKLTEGYTTWTVSKEFEMAKLAIQSKA